VREKFTNMKNLALSVMYVKRQAKRYSTCLLGSFNKHSIQRMLASCYEN